MSPYPHLFSALDLGGVVMRNRIMQTGHAKIFSSAGVDSQRDLDYHVERARGGIGLIVTGNRFVHATSAGPTLRYSWGYLADAVRGDRKICDAVHAHGAKIFAQLNHFGVNATTEGADDLRVLWAPSAVKSRALGESAKAMEDEDLQAVKDGWARSAGLSREAGFDGVEVHLAHGYLLHQFLSPLYNKRTDSYGGSFENRLRFPLDVIRAVRESVGADYIVGVRLSLSDCAEGGLGIDDAIDVAAHVAPEIDYITVTAGGPQDGYIHTIGPSDIESGWLLEDAAKLKASLSGVPVFVVGGLDDPEQAEGLIALGKADMIAMTRAQIADPEFANKVKDGREAEVYHCIRGNQGCMGRNFRGLPIGCTVNPATGREGRFGAGRIAPATIGRRWVVVGGGPAGMKAAEILSWRSHEVILMEAEGSLGGQVNLILKTPGRRRFRWLLEDLERHLEKNGVEVRLQTTGDVDRISEIEPYGVVVATGAVPTRTGASAIAPQIDRIPGADADHVVTAWDVLRESRPVGGRVVVLDDDGGRVVAGVTEVLLDRGCHVRLVSRWNGLLPFTAHTLDMPVLCERLLRKGLEYRLHSWVSKINSTSVEVYNLFTGVTEGTLDGVDTVVLVGEMKARDDLYFALRQARARVYRIGDCVAPRKIDHAVYEGFLAGLEAWTADARYIREGELEAWRDAESDI